MNTMVDHENVCTSIDHVDAVNPPPDLFIACRRSTAVPRHAVSLLIVGMIRDMYVYHVPPAQCINMMVNHNEFGVTEEEFEEHGNDESAVQELLLEKMRRFITSHPEV